MMAPTRNRTRLGRTERRGQIVDAAAIVLGTRDPVNVTFEEIADAAGVSRALLYNYFGDRQGLLEAVEQRHLEELEALVTGSVDGAADDHQAALEACVRAHLEAARRNPAGYRLLAGRTIPGGVAASQADRALGPAVAEHSAMVRAGALAAVQAMVLAAHEDGSAASEGTALVISSFLGGALAGVAQAEPC
jgi:AcrR family transcriptional regulator